jgi:hypothetical protein
MLRAGSATRRRVGSMSERGARAARRRAKHECGSRTPAVRTNLLLATGGSAGPRRGQAGRALRLAALSGELGVTAEVLVAGGDQGPRDSSRALSSGPLVMDAAQRRPFSRPVGPFSQTDPLPRVPRVMPRRSTTRRARLSTMSWSTPGWAVTINTRSASCNAFSSGMLDRPWSGSVGTCGSW